MKKSFSIILLFIILLSAVFSVPINSNATSWMDTGDIYSKEQMCSYRIIGNNQIELTNISYNAKMEDNKTYYIPSEIDGYTVVSIGKYVFSSNGLQEFFSPRKVVIPDTVVRISDYAFYSLYDEYNENLSYSMIESIVIPSSVVYIGDSAFFGNQKLKSIELPENLLYLGEGAFNKSKSLEKIVIPGSVQTLKKNLFANCTSLKEVTVEEGIVEVEKNVFYNCKSLNKVVFYDNVYLFYDDSLGYYKNRNKNENLKVYVKESKGMFLEYPYSQLLKYAYLNNLRKYYILNSTHNTELDSVAGGVVYLQINDKKVKSWKSSKPSVAKVATNGKFTSLTKGTTTITATFEDGTTYSRTIKVGNNPSMSVKTLKIKKGQTKKVTIIGKADGVKNVYKSTKKAKIIGSVKKNYFKVKGLKKGKTTLKITVNGKVLKLKVKVKAK